MGGEIKFRCFEIYQRIRSDKASASFVYSPSIFEPCTMQKSLAHPQPQSYNADNQKHEKTLPFPVGAKRRQRLGSVSDHRTYHTHPRNTRKSRVQRVPKRKWMGAERVRKSSRLLGKFDMTLRVQEAAGSNPVTRTKKRRRRYVGGVFCFA